VFPSACRVRAPGYVTGDHRLLTRLTDRRPRSVVCREEPPARSWGQSDSEELHIAQMVATGVGARLIRAGEPDLLAEVRSA